ncbi:IS110 family transposase [Methylococcaceae bacterium CS1]|nr:IS110 family transposase [Methylococcaceae bacterium CS1]
MSHFIGIDVAKATLQVYIPQGQVDLEFANTTSGLHKLYKTLKLSYKESLQELVLVYESTGCYSRPLEEFCQKKEINCFKVGAYQSASFSKTIKNRNKTDKVDARMLSAMQILVGKGDIKIPYRDDDAHQLRSYIKYYQSLNKEKTRQKNYLEAAEINQEDDYILKQVRKRIKQIDKEQENFMALSMKLIKANTEYLNAYENITSIKGLGQKSGIVLLYLFLRYPNASRQQITALTGLDPVQRESGTSLKHKTRMSKQGISLVRGLLYMPILSTVQHNDEMKRFYERLVESGKVKMSAQIAVMRKVVLLAHSLYKNNEKYDETKYLNFI